jgi:hypothetical protein
MTAEVRSTPFSPSNVMCVGVSESMAGMMSECVRMSEWVGEWRWAHGWVGGCYFISPIHIHQSIYTHIDPSHPHTYQMLYFDKSHTMTISIAFTMNFCYILLGIYFLNAQNGKYLCLPFSKGSLFTVMFPFFS